MSLPRLQLEATVLLVVDLQEGLLRHIDEADRVVSQSIRLIRGCAALGVPIIATEQYPKGLGVTVESVRAVLPVGTLIEPKLKFSAYVEGVRHRLAELGRSTVLVCGIESHVCMTQTVLDLIDAGFLTAVAVDTVGSRRKSDREIGLARMAAVGAVMVSMEMALLEMVREAGTERFKAVLPFIK
jgi:nicotinamidase-related amidase